jgi:predicted enzyme related to lactoylglutathione lyase
MFSADASSGYAKTITIFLPKLKAAGATDEVLRQYHWIHSTADLDRGWQFYHSVFGMELESSPFGGNTGATPRPPRLRSEASADPIVWDLTNTHGSRFRNVFMTVPRVSVGHELSEFSGIEQKAIRANLWDPGATMLILNVDHLDTSLDALKKAGGEIVSGEGKPVSLDGTRAVIARDPDGYLLELIESPKPGAAIGVTVANVEQTRRFYEDFLGFKIQSPARFENKALKIVGLSGGEYRVSSALIPGTSIRIEFYELRNIAGPAGNGSPHTRFATVFRIPVRRSFNSACAIWIIFSKKASGAEFHSSALIRNQSSELSAALCS